jgi:uracil-DNA glycosylase
LTKIDDLRYNFPMIQQIDESWRRFLTPEFEKPYLQDLLRFLEEERRRGKRLFPPAENVFEAFRLTPLPAVKVVILGQDPYHGAGQAHGLAFSVPRGVKPPPSLANIFKELAADAGVPLPAHGHLEAWARQGVLLLNTALTVEEGKAGAHQKKGWERFTETVIDVLNQERDHLVFILWGAPAQAKARHVDPARHLILKSVHPSPLSVYRGFLGSKPFSQANAYLETHGIAPVDWRLT